MSVLIHGMEMPKSCRACLFSRTDIRNADWCVLTEKDLPCDCPLIPVPEHGRLIDGDKFDAYLKTAAIMADGEAKEAYIDARAEAKTMPTIIPADSVRNRRSKCLV